MLKIYKYLIQQIMEGTNKQLQSVVNLLIENLTEGNYQYLKDMSQMQGINSNTRLLITKLTAFFQNNAIPVSFVEKLFLLSFDGKYEQIYKRSQKSSSPAMVLISSLANQLIERKNQVLIIKRETKCYKENIASIIEGKSIINPEVIKSRVDIPNEVKNQIIQLTGIFDKQKKKEKEYSIIEQKNKKIEEQSRQLKKQIQMLNSNIEQQQTILKQSMLFQQEKQQNISTLNKKLQEQMEKNSYFTIQLKKYKDYEVSLTKQIDNLKKQLTFKDGKIKQLSQNNNEYQTSLIKLKVEIENLKKEKQALIELAKKNKYKSKLLVDSNSLISHIQTIQGLEDSLIENIKKNVGEVTSMTSLFNFSLHKGENFHKRVDNRPNILLLCLTEEDRIIGGFTSAGFSLRDQEMDVKSFIFSSSDDKFSVYKLKGDSRSTLYDSDYLIFGNEQLTIEKRSNRLESRFVNGQKDTLHYEYPKGHNRLNFLRNHGVQKNSVILKNYEIIELKINKL